MTDAFPLKWPAHRERTPSYSRKHAPFKTTPGRARDGILHELKKLGARDVVISTNIETYRRGQQDIPYADQSKASDDPGVAVYYTWNGDQYCLACDKWKTVMDNMQALMKTIDAIRGIERWGSGSMVKAAFSGFKELPAAATAPIKKQWYEVLECGQWWNPEDIRNAYKRLAMIYHPDIPVTGSKEKFQEIQQAYEEATR